MRRVSCGRWHCAALVQSGEVFLWGRNHYGQLGIGVVSRACASPVAVVLQPFEKCSLFIRDVAAGKQPTSVISMILSSYKRGLGASHTVVVADVCRDAGLTEVCPTRVGFDCEPIVLETGHSIFMG